MLKWGYNRGGRGQWRVRAMIFPNPLTSTRSYPLFYAFLFAVGSEQKSNKVYLLQRGRISAFTATDEGQLKRLFSCSHGAVVNDECVFLDLPTAHSTVFICLLPLCWYPSLFVTYSFDAFMHTFILNDTPNVQSASCSHCSILLTVALFWPDAIHRVLRWPQKTVRFSSSPSRSCGRWRAWLRS